MQNIQPAFEIKKVNFTQIQHTLMIRMMLRTELQTKGPSISRVCVNDSFLGQIFLINLFIVKLMKMSMTQISKSMEGGS
jgi:hypothetical protein